MVELVDTYDSKSYAFGHEGSSPSRGTIIRVPLLRGFYLWRNRTVRTVIDYLYMKKTFTILGVIIVSYLLIGFLIFTFFTGSRVRDYEAIRVNGSIPHALFVWPYYVSKHIKEIVDESPAQRSARISCKEGEGYWASSCVSYTANECNLDSSPFRFLEFGCESAFGGNMSYVCECPAGTCWDGTECVGK